MAGSAISVPLVGSCGPPRLVAGRRKSPNAGRAYQLLALLPECAAPSGEFLLQGMYSTPVCQRNNLTDSHGLFNEGSNSNGQ